MRDLQLTLPSDAPLKVLCLGAHSDDIEIGCGGTLLAILDHNPAVEVRWVVFSGNESRAQEARESAKAFLSQAVHNEVTVHGYRDGYFPHQGAEIKADMETLKPFAPDLVLTHYRDDRHQDHRTISDLTWNTFRSHLVLEYEIPKYDGDLGQPNLFVPLDAKICERKIQLLVDHFQSQQAKQWYDSETFRSILRLRGLECNSATRYAEAFYSRKATLSWQRT